MASGPSFDHPDDAIRRLAERLRTVPTEPSSRCEPDRVLAETVQADRDSPAADVSAMDGYAARLSDLERNGEISVDGESLPGHPPPSLAPGAVVRIFTGAVVPVEAETVIPRELTFESGTTIRWRPEASSIRLGANIRRTGENTRRGDNVLSPGRRLDATAMAALANFGRGRAALAAAVRVRLITTGDEVVGAPAPDEASPSGQEVPDSAELAPWQLRNSNRAAIVALLTRHRWVSLQRPVHVRDDPEALRRESELALQSSDAVLLTGGVSVGDYDHVPEVVRQVGGEVIFHRLPIRPGKPILGAVTGTGQLILGLPGNPVSAAIGCLRFALPLLARLSGQAEWLPRRPLVRLRDPGEKTLPLHWMRPVKLVGDGVAEPVASRGSGDLVALARSDGFVELPPGASGPGPWPYQAWP